MLRNGILRAVESAPDRNLSRNTRTGLLFFAFYCLIYTTFVFLSAFRSDVMERVVWGGLNVALWYGVGLILGAIGLAILYCWLCRSSRP